MISVEIGDMTLLISFWLAFARVGAIIIQLPLFDQTSIPNIVKVLATLVITYVIFPNISGSIVRDVNFIGVDNFWIITIFYTIVGLLVGFFVKAIMMITTSSGSIITQQMGFSALRYFDPNAGQQVGPFEKLIHWSILILVLTSGALVPMFKGVMLTFDSIRIEDIGPLAASSKYYIDLFKYIFGSSLMLASPLIFTNVLIMTVLGIIARTVPQMNVLMVSFVVNIGVGLLIFSSISDEFFVIAYKMYTEKLGEWFQFVS